MNVISRIKDGASAVMGMSKKNAPPTTAVTTPDGLIDLDVWHVPPNPRLLICHLPGEDGSNPMKLVNVQVRDNQLFLKKMRLRARRVNDKQFILEGPLPRWRGRW